MLIAIIAILFLSKCLSSGMKWHLASQNLDLAMLVIQQLQEKYLAARFVFTYYKAAFEKVACSLRPPREQSAISIPELVLVPNAMDVDSAPKVQTETYDEGVSSTSEVMSNDSGLYDTRGGGERLAVSVAGMPGDLHETWLDCFSPGADFDFLFGVDGRFKGLDEFEFGNMVA